LSEKVRAAQGLFHDSRLVSGAIIENPPRSGIPAKLTGFRLHFVGLPLAIPVTFKSFFVLFVLCSFKETGQGESQQRKSGTCKIGRNAYTPTPNITFLIFSC
jgi:hypothetical protein